MADIILLNSFFDFFLSVFSFVGGSWFLWLPLFLFFILKDTWLKYVKAFYLANTKWVLLEIRVPREIAKSPKAMESIFAGIHGTGRLGNIYERYWKGFFVPWFSFEIVGNSTGVHFYVRCSTFFRRVIESQIFAQYPSCEINEVEDYTKALPSSMPHNEWSMWGTEYILIKPDAYPIRTYEDFTLEKVALKEEERKIDPLSSLMEFLGSLNEGENIWIQMLVRPAGDSWKKEGQQLISKLAGREPKLEEPTITKIIYSIDRAIGGVSATVPEKKESAILPRIMNLTPGEVDVVKAIERNISKIGLEMGLRWIYIAKKDKYNIVAVPAMNGIFRQFSSPTLNGFKPNKLITTSIDYILKGTRETMRKRRLYNAYRLRSFFMPPYNKRSKSFVLSSEELATIYHFPGEVVHAPGFARIEAKKGAPPTNLPM